MSLIKVKIEEKYFISIKNEYILEYQRLKGTFEYKRNKLYDCYRSF